MALGDRRKKKYRDFTMNLAGEYVYTGDYFSYSAGNPISYRSYVKRLGLCAAGAAAALVGSGLFAAPGSTGGALVLIPYMAFFISAGLMCGACVGVMKSGNPMRRFDLEGALDPARRRSMVAGVCSGLTIAGYILHLIFYGAEGKALWAAVLFPVLIGASGVLCICLHKTLKKMVWNNNKNKDAL